MIVELQWRDERWTKGLNRRSSKGGGYGREVSGRNLMAPPLGLSYRAMTPPPGLVRTVAPPLGLIVRTVVPPPQA